MSEAAGIISWLALLAFIASALAAALSDAVRFLIPNRYPAAIALSFAVYAVAKPAPFWAPGLIVAAVALVAGSVLFARGIVGGGDVKLFAATALCAAVDQFPLLPLPTPLPPAGRSRSAGARPPAGAARRGGGAGAAPRPPPGPRRRPPPQPPPPPPLRRPPPLGGPPDPFPPPPPLFGDPRHAAPPHRLHPH